MVFINLPYGKSIITNNGVNGKLFFPVVGSRFDFVQNFHRIWKESQFKHVWSLAMSSLYIQRPINGKLFFLWLDQGSILFKIFIGPEKKANHARQTFYIF
jgi:hypothetical protein